MTKKTSRIIGIVMLVAAAAFVIDALGHPEAGFPWSNTVTYTLYAVYLLAAVDLLLAPFMRA